VAYCKPPVFERASTGFKNMFGLEHWHRDAQRLYFRDFDYLHRGIEISDIEWALDAKSMNPFARVDQQWCVNFGLTD
jgi:hypothetical protein